MIAATKQFPASISRILGPYRDDDDGDSDDDSGGTPISLPPPHTISTPTLASDEYPPLTTIFTPDPSCLSFYVDTCRPSTGSCYAEAFPQAGCFDVGQPTARSPLPCYPSAFDGDHFHFTYSPGYLCPQWMTTVDSVSIPNGTWCCPNGLTWANGLCQTTTSQATLLSTNLNNCGSEERITVSRLINGEGAIVLSATPILLIGQTTPLSSTTSSSAASPTSLIPTSDPKDVPTNQHSLSKAAGVGIIVSILLAVFGLLFASFYLRMRSKAKAVKEVQAEQAVKEGSDEYTGKPELEGSKAYVYTIKAELDATAIRAELEGDLREPDGDGIYPLKPELEGTAGTERNRGAYVKKKSELEAMSKPCTSTTQQNLADSEVVAPEREIGPVLLKDQISG
ncbi:hypothetical protein F4801DRAFT_530364 [Xylaria longipes]|nr:hypothetical protein F4801DRAFT_530364 [Xylaria longipes]